MALGEALPQVMLGASYGYSYLTEKSKWNGVAFVTVKVPITDWGKISKKWSDWIIIFKWLKMIRNSFPRKSNFK